MFTFVERKRGGGRLGAQSINLEMSADSMACIIKRRKTSESEEKMQNGKWRISLEGHAHIYLGRWAAMAGAFNQTAGVVGELNAMRRFM